jgi:hypothetical protein
MADQGGPKRRFPRYHTSLDVIVYQAQKTIQARICQISRGGCLAFPPLPPLQAGDVKISFRLRDDLPYINCKGEIAYNIQDKGTGIAFTEISLYNQDLITSHFERQLAAERPGNPAG